MMEPFQRQADFEVLRHNGEVKIPQAVDMRFRQALLAEAAQCGVPAVHVRLSHALANGPSPGGVAETMKHFGSETAAISMKVAPLVEGMETRHPGFSKWLNVTGFGNDKDMIAAFLLWAERRGGA